MTTPDAHALAELFLIALLNALSSFMMTQSLFSLFDEPHHLWWPWIMLHCLMLIIIYDDTWVCLHCWMPYSIYDVTKLLCIIWCSHLWPLSLDALFDALIYDPWVCALWARPIFKWAPSFRGLLSKGPWAMDLGPLGLHSVWVTQRDHLFCITALAATVSSVLDVVTSMLSYSESMSILFIC